MIHLINNMRMKQLRIFSGAEELDAYRYIYFAMYYNQFQNTLIHSYKEVQGVFGMFYSIANSGDIEKIKTMCKNAYAGYENATKLIPYEYKALDCITKGIDASELHNDETSFSFNNGTTLMDARASIRSFYRKLDTQLDSRFCDDNFYKAEIIEKKNKFVNDINAIVNIPVIDNVFDIYSQVLEQSDLESIENFEPIDLIGGGTVQDYREKYLNSINKFALNLGFKSLSDLQNISVLDYFSKISIETDRAMR